MGETARRTFIATIVVVAVVVATLALWELRILIALIFLGLVLAAAMRPGIDALARHRIPRPLGVALHYLGIAAVLALLLWLVVPSAVDQIGQAIGGVPTSKEELAQQTKHSSGLKHEILAGVQNGWTTSRPPAGSSAAPSRSGSRRSRSSSASSSSSPRLPTGSSSATGRCGSSSRACHASAAA